MCFKYFYDKKLRTDCSCCLPCCSITIADILERWESPPLNDLHKSLHRINGRLAHYDSSFVNIEHSQGHQTALLNSLQ